MSCVLDYGQQPPVLKCSICGGTVPFSLPIGIGLMVKVIRDFEAQHGECWKKTAPKWKDVPKP